MDEAQRARDRIYVDSVEGREYVQYLIPAMFVAHAATNTVATAMTTDIDGTILAVERDQDLDPDAYLPSSLCASACVGGLDIHQEMSEKAAARFGKWYLPDAIPQVMINNAI
nr:Imm5 family immunity protein [Stenotrophomonas sp. Iso1]